MPAIPKTSFSTNLDILRALAVLCVFAAHMVAVVTDPKAGSLGRFGVVLFFVHTSLVLMYSMQRLDELAESRVRLVAAFWVRRIFRIYPLLIVVVIAIVLFHVPGTPKGVYVWRGTKVVVENLLLVQNVTSQHYLLGVLWSLPLEVDMYVLLPIGYFLARRAGCYGTLVMWLVSVPLAMAGPHAYWRFKVLLYAPCFVAGIVAYGMRWYREEGHKRLPYWTWPLGLLAVIALFGPFDDVPIEVKIHRAWILALVTALLYTFTEEAPVRGWNVVPHWIAEHSYGIYLTHTILFWVLLRPMAAVPLWVRLVLLFPGAILIPAVLYRYIERPLMLAANHLSRRILHPHLRH